MTEWLTIIFSSPIPNLFIIVGLVFLGIAVVGNISGKIQPGRGGRVLSALLGFALVGGGLWMYSNPSTDTRKPSSLEQASSVSLEISASTTAPTIPALFRIVEMPVRADPFDYSGICPVTITFSGRISAAGPGGTVSYKWIRSDGASAPVEILVFDGPGSKDISTTWSIGGSGMDYSGWQAIEVFDPQSNISEHADFRIRCQ